MWFCIEGNPIPRPAWEEAATKILSGVRHRLGSKGLKQCLLLPPDITRYDSGAGDITSHLHQLLVAKGVKAKAIPTLGQHQPHTKAENKRMFPGIPPCDLVQHNWLHDCKEVDSISADLVADLTKGAANWPIPIELNKRLFEPKVDAILNIGRVVPHEIFGMSNHNKNIFIGLGGKRTLCSSQMAAACYGLEKCLGKTTTPIRTAFDSIEANLFRNVLNVYILLVKTAVEGCNEEQLTGLYVGEDKETYTKAALYAQKHTIHQVEGALENVVCYVPPEHKSTWVANKAIYRTRMAMKEGGRLLVVGPGINKFGEQKAVDALIRRFGYKGKKRILEAFRSDSSLADYGNAAAHLIHGSSEGKFNIAYSTPHLPKEDINNVGYDFVPFEEAMKYIPKPMNEGTHNHAGKTYTFIPRPDRGLWTTEDPVFFQKINDNSRA